MGKVCWDFPYLGTGNQSGGDVAAAKLFQGVGIMDSLAREVCQNSIDARNKNLDPDVPVVVKFRLVMLKKSDCPSFWDEYEEIINNSEKFWNKSILKTEKVIRFVDGLKRAIKRDEIPVLVMSDYNTMGLSLDTIHRDIPLWNSLVNSEGISLKQDDSSLGSFGVGKYAPFSYSSLSAVAYNTFAQDGSRAFQCVSRIVTSMRDYEGALVPTSSTGKYLFLENMAKWRPIYPDDGDSFANMELFNREENEYGTDVAILGFDYNDWEDDLAVAILKNYLVGIMRGKLKVIIQSEDETKYVIDCNTYENILLNQLKDKSTLNITRQNYHVLTSPDKNKNATIADSGDLSIFVKYSPDFEGVIARFRESGMFINTVASRGPHLAGVVIVNDVGQKKFSLVLHDAEPPAHNEWTRKYIDEKDTKRRNLFGNLTTKMKKEINALMDLLDTRDLGDVIDTGTGKYISLNEDDESEAQSEDAGTIHDTEIEEVRTVNGRVLYTGSSVSATSGEGEGDIYVHRNGKRKRRKRKTKNGIPGKTRKGNTPISVPGQGKLRMEMLDIRENRTFNMGGGKYRLLVNADKDYEKVEIRYYAILENGSEESVQLKHCEDSTGKEYEVKNSSVQGIMLKQGINILNVEFAEDDVMAVKPVFRMEIEK